MVEFAVEEQGQKFMFNLKGKKNVFVKYSFNNEFICLFGVVRLGKFSLSEARLS